MLCRKIHGCLPSSIREAFQIFNQNWINHTYVESAAKTKERTNRASGALSSVLPHHCNVPFLLLLLFRAVGRTTGLEFIDLPRSGSSSHEFSLRGLGKFTSYQVVARAYNTQGEGPASTSVVATTLEDGESVLSRMKPKSCKHPSTRGHCMHRVRISVVERNLRKGSPSACHCQSTKHLNI